MIHPRDLAVEAVETAFWDALGLCHVWCKDEDYTYDFSHIIQVAKLILEEHERIRVANET